MTEEQLQEIEARAESSRGGILDALIKQQDVPALLAEVRHQKARIRQLFDALMTIRNRETSADTWVYKTANKAMCEAPKVDTSE